jgi:ATPase subunit of ABC transporter with duplicated ATPase domains
LATGTLEPTSGRVHHLGSECYAVQRTDEPPAGWHEFMAAYEAEPQELRRRLGIQPDWEARWETLSHGERKRAQIGAVLWAAPEVLALDEPTNHIDADARRLLLDALQRYRGVGLLVSHDRELLDGLCQQCLFIDPPSAVMRPGGVTQGSADQRREWDSTREQDSDARHAAERLRGASQRRREEGERTAARTQVAKHKKLPIHDHDGRAKRQLAKMTGKDDWANKQSSALSKRAGKTAAMRAGLKVKKEYEMGFWLEDSACSTRNAVLQVPEGELPLGGGRRLVFPELRMDPTARVALTGANGLGKSTLVRHLLGFVNVPPERLIYVPQEVTAPESKRVLEDIAKLPKESLGRVMTSVSRLGSRPGRLLESEQPSPGEVRKLLLALGVDHGPHLILMDEPTNHMDLPSIGCLEEALEECPCALLLVSHDLRFLDGLVEWRWHLVAEGDTVRLRVSPWQELTRVGARPRPAG